MNYILFKDKDFYTYKERISVREQCIVFDFKWKQNKGYYRKSVVSPSIHQV